MYETMMKEAVIVLLTILGLFTGKFPIYLMIAGSLCLIVLTFEAFDEKHGKLIRIIEGVVFLVFAILTNHFCGFLVFYFMMKWNPCLKGFVGILCYCVSEISIYHVNSLPMCILNCLLLAVGFAISFGIEKGWKVLEKRKNTEMERSIATNISEMHEKRLNEELSVKKAIDERNARLMERENISRNIHNSVGHSITAAIMTLDAADMLYDVKPEEARKKMNDANERMRGSLESIRRAVRVLDEDNQDLTALDLKSELHTVVKEFVMDTTIQVYENYDDMPDEVMIPHDHVVFFTGVLQEMLTNGLKHGNATNYVVTLIGDSRHVRFDTIDDGSSDFSEENRQERLEKGFGLKKIESYVEKNGGRIQFENENGFHTQIEMPILIHERSI